MEPQVARRRPERVAPPLKILIVCDRLLTKVLNFDESVREESLIGWDPTGPPRSGVAFSRPNRLHNVSTTGVDCSRLATTAVNCGREASTIVRTR